MDCVGGGEGRGEGEGAGLFGGVRAGLVRVGREGTPRGGEGEGEEAKKHKHDSAEM